MKNNRPPEGGHVTYQSQYRKCGKAACSTCRNGQGHGPYWYAYWREGGRVRSRYLRRGEECATRQPRASGRVPPSLFGALIRERRKAMGLTCKELGALTGYSAAYIRAVEYGHRRPSDSIIAALARALSIDGDELTALKGDKEEV